MIAGKAGKTNKEEIFDVNELAKYLKVGVCWVRKQVSYKTIPYFKCGDKFVRFKKSEIDKWVKSKTICPIP